MRKLKVTEMGRMSVAEYRASDKQPIVVVLDHVRSLYNVGSVFRSSPKMLIRAAAFFQGKCLASFEDIGCSNIDEVITRLVAELPADIPERCIVQFKVVNCDNGKVAIYERQKGKGF